jgi:hypothetical protein
MRKRNGHSRESAADPKIEMVERTGMDADEDIVGAQVRFVDVGVVKDGGVAVLMEEDGFDRAPPGRYIVSRYEERMAAQRRRREEGK